MSCIFCKIVEGAIPCHKVAETTKALAFMDINPLARGHVLVIPKQHAERLHQCDLDSAADVGRLIAKISRVTAGPDGETQYNVLQNNGKLAHQEVPHVHFHIIPKRDESSGLRINSWEMMPTNHELFAQDAAAIREELEKIQE